MDWTFWYGERNRPGLKEEMRKEDEEDIANGGSRMMPLPVMKEEDLIRIVKRQKNGKAVGTDGVKTEMMKHMVKNKKIRKGLVNAFNKCLKEKVHPNWMESNTTMLPKSKKPNIKEHRPIAVTNWSSKVFCTFVREKMEIHMITWGIRFEEQYGFTEGGRVEQCLYTVNYITNRTFESQKAEHKYLYLAMIDFSKAYDSVDRKKMIETMREYRINIRIIEMIVQLYSKDSTTIKLGGLEEKVRVTSGIRQGCCISTLLFKMITFKIIEELREKGVKYQVDKYNGNSVWLADDSTLIAGSKRNMQTNIRILKNKALEYGLKMNDNKSKIIQVRGTEKTKKIEGLEVVETVKYLGVTLGGVGRDIFREERNNVIEKAQKRH